MKLALKVMTTRAPPRLFPLVEILHDSGYRTPKQRVSDGFQMQIEAFTVRSGTVLTVTIVAIFRADELGTAFRTALWISVHARARKSWRTERWRRGPDLNR
jgi:hypothetical protein